MGQLRATVTEAFLCVQSVPPRKCDSAHWTPQACDHSESQWQPSRFDSKWERGPDGHFALSTLGGCEVVTSHEQWLI